jgi:outer membrane protein TolC
MVKYLLLFALMMSTAIGATPLRLTESYLEQLALKGSPSLDEIEAAFLSTQLRQGETHQAYAPELFGRASYAETNERALIAFQPIFSPVKQAQVGVRQNFKQGLSTEAAVTTDQRSSSTSPFAGTFQNATTTTLSFTVQLDLWKNLFGRMSKAELESSQIDAKRAKLQKDIQTKTFSISLRRLYWSLVANQEAIKISEELLKTAQRLLSETQARFKNAVADADEVARYQALVANRQGTLLYLQFQRENLVKQLRNLLPELATSDLELAEYDLSQTMTQVLACTATIAERQTVPYDFTHYDEMVSIMRKIRSNNSVINARYSDVDIKLFGTVKATGVDSAETIAGNRNYRGSYGGSWDDITGTNRSGYEVGMLVSLPLGDAKTNTQKTKELYDEKRLYASINSTEAQVINTHIQLVRSISLLTEVIKAQKVSSAELSKRLLGMRRKYEQARVSVNDLIQDQDAFLSSELTTIDTQLQILNTIFDYLVVFTETPCSFNRI